MLERMLERRPEEGVVDGDERLRRVRARDVDGVRDVAHASVGLAGVSTKTSFEIGERGGGARQRVAIAGRHADRREAERFEHLVDEVLRAAVERLRVKKRRPARQEREAAGRDRRHARVEDGRALRAALERHELIFENLGVRVREPRVDQVDVFVLGRRELAERDRERALGGLGAREHERRRAEDRRARRADRERRIEAAREDRGLGADAVGRLRHAPIIRVKPT